VLINIYRITVKELSQFKSLNGILEYNLYYFLILFGYLIEYIASCKAASSPLLFNEYYHLKIEEPMKLLPAVSVEEHEHKLRPSKINGMAQSISTACNDIQEYSCPMKKN